MPLYNPQQTVPVDGWISANETWAYASATTITVPSGAANKYAKGDKIKLTANSVVLYAYIVGIADTVLTVAGNAITNHTITANYYSHQTSPIGFPNYFAYTPTISWTASVAPSGSPVRKEYFWVEGSICHVRINDYSWTAGTNVTGASIPLPFAITTQYHYCNGQISITDVIPATPGYNYVNNSAISLTCTSVAASIISASADYYY